MTDLPTRLRTRADLHDTLTAGLMRDAADEIERLREQVAHYADVAMSKQLDATEVALDERDVAVAELAGLRAGYEILQRENRRLCAQAADPMKAAIDHIAPDTEAVVFENGQAAYTIKIRKISPSPASSPIVKTEK